MEIFRDAGVESAIRSASALTQEAEIARGRNLADPDITWMGDAWPDTTAVSATAFGTLDQDRLEPILRARAEELGATCWFDTELVDLAQDDDLVTAHVHHRDTGVDEIVTADHVVAADGVDGTIRERVGIGRQGPGPLQHWMNLIFDTDLEPRIDGRAFTSCFVTDVNGTLVPRDVARWLLSVQYAPEAGERPADFDDEQVRTLVRRAAGRDDVRADLFDARSWEVAAYVADRFRSGRVFLVGDAAHVMPPTGGFGGNTGIHDAHNLAWKLAAVHRGDVRDVLLDTYDAERGPIVRATVAQALARLSAWFEDPAGKLPPPVDIVDGLWVIFGGVYPDGAFVPEIDAGAPPFEDPFEDPTTPSGRPGARPHRTRSSGPTGSPSTTASATGSHWSRPRPVAGGPTRPRPWGSGSWSSTTAAATASVATACRSCVPTASWRGARPRRLAARPLHWRTPSAPLTRGSERAATRTR